MAVLSYMAKSVAQQTIPSFCWRDNSVYFYNMYIVKMFEILLFFIVKDNNIFPCLHHIRLSYNIKLYKCFSAFSIRMRMST